MNLADTAEQAGTPAAEPTLIHRRPAPLQEIVGGMTVNDMIEGIAAIFGPASRPNIEIAYHSNYAEVANILAHWEDAPVREIEKQNDRAAGERLVSEKARSENKPNFRP